MIFLFNFIMFHTVHNHNTVFITFMDDKPLFRS